MTSKGSEGFDAAVVLGVIACHAVQAFRKLPTMNSQQRNNKQNPLPPPSVTNVQIEVTLPLIIQQNPDD